ncbi:MAG: hypothetical protein ACKOFA_03355 [Rhodoluna sp.]
MSDFDSAKFKKKLKKKIRRRMNGKRISIKTSGPIYFLGGLGAAIYYVSTATDFWMGVLGILKALVWPAFLIFAALSGLKA